MKTETKVLFPHLNSSSDEKIKALLTITHHLGLNPFETYFIQTENGIQLAVTYVEYLKRAEKSKKLDGWNIQFDGSEEKAIVTIHRKDWKYPFVWEVHLREVQKNSSQWLNNSIGMLKRVAIAQAFRICFPEEAGSLPYEIAEII